jgi:ketosteroid isomerase-like protein
MPQLRVAAALLVAVTLPPSRAAAATDPPVPTKEIVRTLTALEERWIQVYTNHDLSLLHAILSDDFVATLADGEMRGKEKHIAAYKEDFEAYSAVANSEVRVHVFSADTAVVTGLYGATLRKPAGADPVERYRWTDTWLKRKGSWQCVATQETRVK